MSRIRTVKPSFFRSLTVCGLDKTTRLTFIGLWTYADDEGRGVDNAKLVKAELWPLDDDYTVKLVERDLAALAEAGLINRYSVCGKKLLCITTWKEHQVINRKSPSVLPDPLESDEDSRSPHGTISEDSHREGKGMEGKGIKPCDPEPGHVDVPDDFSDFWNLYPKRNDKKLGKATSGRLWSKLSHGDRAVALSAVTNYAEACDTALTISKDPERWLRGRCWVDWLEPAKVASSTRAVGGVLAGSVAFGDSYYGRSQR